MNSAEQSGEGIVICSEFAFPNLALDVYFSPWTSESKVPTSTTTKGPAWIAGSTLINTSPSALLLAKLALVSLLEKYCK